MRQELKKAMRIPRFGFTIEKRHKIIDRDKAFEILTPAYQSKITFAVLKNDHVVITKHVIVCPWCGKTTPAYYSLQVNPQPMLNAWLAQQISFFNELPSTLVFNKPIEKMHCFACPNCHAKSYQSKGFVDVLFTVDKKKIVISRKLELQEWFQIKWGVDNIHTTECELYETITFHINNGRTFVVLETGRGEKLQIRDISNIKPDIYFDDPIFELINLYKPVNRELKNQFVKIFHGSLPFRTKELTVEQFLLMTRFVGYDSEFYNALPYAEKGNLIEKRFSKSSVILHNAANVPNIFEKTTLPKVKSIQKLFFGNPALLFYTKELEQLWEIIEDVNLFRDFIASRNIFLELAFLHKMPYLIHFYAEYKSEVGIKQLYRHFFRPTNRYGLYSYISWYYLLSQYDKKMEHQKWHHTEWLEEQHYFVRVENEMGSLFSISIPDRSSDRFRYSGLECRIGRYSFRRLKNSMNFLQADKELKGGLCDWIFFQNNVYGIIENGKYVAAVEIKDNLIIQVYTYRNVDISDNHNLKKAFDVWKSRNLLTE